jgi:hypothetical protein
MELLKALQIVHSYGFPLEGGFATPMGGETVWCDNPEDAYLSRVDEREFAAKMLGCSVSEYDEWLACRGAPLCGSRARSGKLCKNSLGSIHHSVTDWLKSHRQGFCSKHE